MKSKFDGIFNRDKAEAPPVATEAPPSPAPIETPPHPKRGRPPGKRSDPGFKQATCYIPAALHHKVMLALLQDGQRQEFSELVGGLLAEWIKSRS